MIRRSDITVSDALGTPEGGVYITVKAEDGTVLTLYNDDGTTLANPFQSGLDGTFVYNIADSDAGTITEEFRLSLSSGPRKTQAISLGDFATEALEIGLFTQANLRTIPIGVDLVQTTGYASTDKGAAVYVYDAAVDSTYVTAHPLSSFLSANSRGFRLSTEQGVTPQMFGALVDGTTDDAAAMTAAAAFGISMLFGGTLKTNSVPSVLSLISFGASFNGSAAVDSSYPAFEPGALSVVQKGNGFNCFIGIAHNNLPANTNAEPVGVTGYGRVDNAGNAGFGVFGRADLYANTGVAQNEFNAWNFGANPSSTFPVDRSIGTAQSVSTAVLATAGGTKNSHTAYYIGPEGSQPQSFLNGLHGDASAIVNYFQVLSNGSTLLYWVKPDGSMLAKNITLTPVAVASLPAAGTVGRRCFVTDANSTTFAAVVAAGGSNKVPVYDDGTNWRIG